MKCGNIGCKFNIDRVCHCKENPLPLISCGKNKEESVRSITERRTGLSSKEIKAYNYRIKGKRFSWIAKELKCSKSTAHGYFKKVEGVYKDNKGVSIPNDKGFSKKPNAMKRLHNDVISFLIEPINFWGEPNIIKLKHCSYLLVKEEKYHIQIFESKLVVRFKDDIVCNSLSECRDKSNERIINFLKNFEYKGVRFKDDKFEQVSRHYAILGNSLAKKYIRENKKFYVFDRTDGKRRLSIDNSHGKPEFECEHPIKSLNDADIVENVFDDIINNPDKVDLPTVTKTKLDSLVYNVDKFAKNSNSYAENIELHLSVLKEMSDTLKDIKKFVRYKK